MAGPHAKCAGADLKETCAAFGIPANTGLKGSLAGTALGMAEKWIGGTVSNIKALAAAATQAEKGNAARIALENRRHWNELQNAAKEAKNSPTPAKDMMRKRL